MREPKVKNKYNLKPSDIPKLKVLNKDAIHKSPFWRNDVIGAWCLSGSSGNILDWKYGTDDEYWLGIYDEDAKAYKGKIRCNFSSYGGMCWYKFSKFFDYEQIKNEVDLEIQEKFIGTINQLIDDGVLGIYKGE